MHRPGVSKALCALLAVTVLLAIAHVRDQRALQAYASATELSWRQHAIIKTRGRVHACQNALGKPRSPVAQRVVTGGAPYRAWVLRLWRKRERFYCAAARQLSDPIRAIHAVFGPYGSQAVAVARCETGGTFSVYAQNGQYLGLFQMGEYARSAYGHGWTPLEQARAAYRYFVASGRDWSPWQCRPDGMGW